MLDVLSLAHYVDEALAAFDELASRDRCGRIFLLGHSEGSIHASSAAIAKQADPRFGGLISLSGPSRSLLDTAIEQIRAMRHQRRGRRGRRWTQRARGLPRSDAEARRTAARSVRDTRGRGRCGRRRMRRRSSRSHAS